MTCVILCFLAFCAFEIVSAANLADDVAASFHKSTVPMNDAYDKSAFDISAAADTVKSNEITPGQIYNKCGLSTDAAKQFNKIYGTKTDKCQQCYNKAKNTKDIQNAEDCCKKIAEEFKEDIKSFMTQAKTCIADIAKKCSKSAIGCREEATNSDKVHANMTKELEKSFAKKYGN